MTLEREHRNGPFVVQCDACSETQELEGGTFHEALDDAKEQGFQPRMESGEWVHYCKDCK